MIEEQVAAHAGDVPGEFEVFISHRSGARDTAVARLIAEGLEAQGIRVFLDTKDILGGDSFIRPILRSVRRSRLVIVLFGDDLSSWVHFEAAVAFFDEKLLPVALNGVEVPNPYRRIQHHIVAAPDAGRVDREAVDRVVAQARHRLRGDPRHAFRTRCFRFVNRLHVHGIWIAFLLVIPFLLFPLTKAGAELEALGWLDPLVLREHLNHLHVTLGAAILGGQFFLTLAFARSVSSPSFREREYGFEAIEQLFFVWALLAFVQPMLGLALACWGLSASQCLVSMPGWLWLSTLLYVLGLFITFIGYVVARHTRGLDRAHDSPTRITAQDFAANAIFLVGFLVTVAVLNLMITCRGAAC